MASAGNVRKTSYIIYVTISRRKTSLYTFGTLFFKSTRDVDDVTRPLLTLTPHRNDCSSFVISGPFLSGVLSPLHAFRILVALVAYKYYVTINTQK